MSFHRLKLCVYKGILYSFTGIILHFFFTGIFLSFTGTLSGKFLRALFVGFSSFFTGIYFSRAQISIFVTWEKKHCVLVYVYVILRKRSFRNSQCMLCILEACFDLFSREVFWFLIREGGGNR